jgi:hypothetical protein
MRVGALSRTRQHGEGHRATPTTTTPPPAHRPSHFDPNSALGGYHAPPGIEALAAAVPEVLHDFHAIVVDSIRDLQRAAAVEAEVRRLHLEVMGGPASGIAASIGHHSAFPSIADEAAATLELVQKIQALLTPAARERLKTEFQAFPMF